MSEKNENRPTVYYIPENFGSDSKVLGGRIRVRYLLDSVLLGAALFIAAGLPLTVCFLREQTLSTRLTVSLCVMAPGIAAGILGVNGDPVSAFLINLIHWKKSSDTCLYNFRPAPMGTDPIRVTIESGAKMDRFVELWQQREQDRYDRKYNEQFTEGETFIFDEDPREAYTEESGDFDSGELAAAPPDNITIRAEEDDFGKGLEELMRLFEEEGDGSR